MCVHQLPVVTDKTVLVTLYSSVTAKLCIIPPFISLQTLYSLSSSRRLKEFVYSMSDPPTPVCISSSMLLLQLPASVSVSLSTCPHLIITFLFNCLSFSFSWMNAGMPGRLKVTAIERGGCSFCSLFLPCLTMLLLNMIIIYSYFYN